MELGKDYYLHSSYRMRPSERVKLEEKLKNNEVDKEALLNLIDGDMEHYASHDGSDTYMWASILTQIDVWNIVTAADLRQILDKTNAGIRLNFMDGLPETFRNDLGYTVKERIIDVMDSFVMAHCNDFSKRSYRDYYRKDLEKLL